MTLRSHCFSPPIPEQGTVAPYTEIFVGHTNDLGQNKSASTYSDHLHLRFASACVCQLAE